MNNKNPIYSFSNRGVETNKSIALQINSSQVPESHREPPLVEMSQSRMQEAEGGRGFANNISLRQMLVNMYDFRSLTFSLLLSDASADAAQCSIETIQLRRLEGQPVCCCLYGRTFANVVAFAIEHRCKKRKMK